MSSPHTAEIEVWIITSRNTGKVNIIDIAGETEIVRKLGLRDLFFFLLRDRNNEDTYCDFILHGDEHTE